MSGILRRGAAVALLVALAAAMAWSAPAPEPGVKDPRSPRDIEEAQRDLRSLRRLAEADKPDLEELWMDWQRFRTAYAGSPEWVQACAVMSKAPSPLDRLDREQIPAEDRPPWLPKEVVAVLGENRGRHWGDVCQIAVTPDNQVVAASPEGVRLWDAALHERAFFPEGYSRFALAAKKRILAIARDKQVVLWDLSGEKPKEGVAFPDHPDDDVAGIESVALTSDGRTGAVCWRVAEQGRVEVWDLSGAAPRRRRVIHTERRLNITRVALSGGGKWLADDGGRGSWVRLWDLGAGEKKAPVKLEGVGAPMIFSPDDKLLAVKLSDLNGIRLFDLSGDAPKSLRDLRSDNNVMGGMAFAPDGKTLASTNERQLQLWPMDDAKFKELSLAPGQTHATFPLSLYANTVAYFPDGKTLALGCQDAVRLWDLGKSEERYPVRGHACRVVSAAFSPDGQMLASASDDYSVRLWNLTGAVPKERAVAAGPTLPLKVLFRGDGSTLLAAEMEDLKDGRRFNLRAWDTAGQKLKEQWVFEPHHELTNDFALSSDGTLMATTGIDVHGEGYPPGISTVQLWQFEDGKAVRKGSTRLPPVFKGEEENHLISFCGLEPFSPDGRLLICGVGSNDLRLVDVTTKPPKVKWVIHTVARETEESSTATAVFSPDGKTVATGGYVADDHDVQHGRILLWDLSDPQPKVRTTLEEPSSDVMHVAFSPDGKSLAGVDIGGVLALWDAGAGRKLREWPLPGKVEALLFAPDGRHLATANENGTVYIFRADFGAERTGEKEGKGK